MLPGRMEYITAVCAGFALDFFIGDPEGWYHPVRAIGWLIRRLETLLRGRFSKTRRGELAAGAALAALVAGAASGVSWLLLSAAGLLHPALRFFLMCVMCGQLLAARSLRTESMRVYRALLEGDVKKARRAVSMIVGRDTENLTEEGIIKAAVETVAENASDGVIAPIFWMLLFGPVGGFFYKAVNTMDSMVGYKNEAYRYFGRAAARLDDAANWIPARLTGLFLVVAAWLLPGFDGANAWRVWRRDRRRHESPNSAQGEAACAGALSVQLAGEAYYFGVLRHKPVIGDPLRPVTPEDIERAGRLMYAAAFLALLFGSAAAWLGYCFFIS